MTPSLATVRGRCQWASLRPMNALLADLDLTLHLTRTLACNICVTPGADFVQHAVTRRQLSPTQKSTIVPCPFESNSSYRADFVQHAVTRRQLGAKEKSTLEEAAFEGNSSYRECWEQGGPMWEVGLPACAP